MAGTLNDTEKKYKDADIVDVNPICFDVTTSCGDVDTICVQVGFEAEEAASASKNYWSLAKVFCGLYLYLGSVTVGSLGGSRGGSLKKSGPPICLWQNSRF